VADSSGSIKGRSRIDYLSDHKLLKKDFDRGGFPCA
jgi:hypothetical protein